MSPTKLDTRHLPQRIDALLRTNEALSSIERISILNALVHPQAEIQEVREKIATMQKQLEGLARYEEDLALEIAPYQGLLSPFRRMPNEILGEIFIACLPRDHLPLIDIQQPPLLLTQISSHLRQVALSTPRLWTAINIPITLPCLTRWPDGRDESRQNLSWRTMQKYAMITREWLGRTGVCPVEISIHEFGNSGSEYYVEELFQILVELAGRWKSVSLHCSGYSVQTFFETLGRSYSKFDFPTLQRLNIDISGPQGLLDDSEEEFNNASHLLHASNLHSIRLVLPEDRYEDYHFRWSHLTFLSLGSALHPVLLDLVVRVLKTCLNLVNCKLYVKMDNTNLCLRLPYLKALSLFFDQEGWFDAALYRHELLENAYSLCNNLDLPLLERITYDASVDFLPLLGLLHRIGDQITHLSVTHFEVPTELIECLQACPILVSLDVSRPDGIAKAIRKQYQRPRPAWWASSLVSWTTAGDQLLRYLMAWGDIDNMIRRQLCPHLEHLGYHISDGPMSCGAVNAFILNKFYTGARIKRLSAFIRGGPENLEWLRHSVEEQLLAGLHLRLLPGRTTSCKHISTHPVMTQLEWWDDMGNHETCQ